MKRSYAAQKIGSALFTLMTSSAPTLRERFHCVEQMGILTAVFAGDFPEVMRGDWHRLMGAMYPREGTLAAVRDEALSGESSTRTSARPRRSRRTCSKRGSSRSGRSTQSSRRTTPKASASAGSGGYSTDPDRALRPFQRLWRNSTATARLLGPHILVLLAEDALPTQRLDQISRP